MSREFFRRHRRTIAAGAVLAALVGFLYFVLPQITGVSSTLRRLRHADPWWIALGVVLEAVSLAGYVLLFRTVFSCHGVRIGWRESYQINLAGTVATKFLAAAGADQNRERCVKPGAPLRCSSDNRPANAA